MDHFSSINAFVLVVETNSFAGAARRLHRATSSVTRQVSALEEYLGTQLLNRSTRKVTLTAAGEQYYQNVVNILEDLGEANRNISESGGPPRGLLRITVPVSFGRLHIAPLLSDFSKAYPLIELDVLLSDSYINLIEERIDVAIRLGSLESSNLIARKIAPLKRLVCASPQYFKENGKPSAPHDLSNHNCLAFNYASGEQTWKFSNSTDMQEVKIHGSFRANNSEMLLEAAVNSIGIILMPSWLVSNDVKSGNLETVLNDWNSSIGGENEMISMVYLPNRRGSKKVRAFISYLNDRIGSPPYWD